MAQSTQPPVGVSIGGGAPQRETYIEAAAWRCREQYKLDPAAAPHSEHIGGAALQRRHEELSLFERVSRPEMRRLFSELARTDHVLLLTDETGTILEICADATNTALARAAGMAPGFIWDERHEGTNGPGTCLHDGRPRVVHRDDHFFLSNGRMTCSAAPIWGPNGRLLGAFDVSRLHSSDSRASQATTIALVSFAARIIEQLYFINLFPDCLILRLHDQPIAVGLPQDALLAIAEDGHIRAADSAAPARFGASDTAGLVGRSIAELLDISVERLFERAERGTAAVWPIEIGRGGLTYASLWPSRNAVRRSAPRGSPAENGRRPSVRTEDPQAARHPLPSAAARRVPLIASSGCDPRMAENIARANSVMDRDIHILLQGETGTGKDTFARAIHRASARFDRPFIVINCAAIPETLIESELFGYRPGAFTGARSGGMRGKVLAAHGGTLFLDEIGDMPMTVQARLLRLLEDKEIVPLGGAKPVPVDLKVISATHRELPLLVERGDFRMDLYYRLNGVTLTLPPLRERRDRRALIGRICEEESEGGTAIDPAALAALMAHDWPGNIRELRNTLRTAIALAGSGPVELAHLPPGLRARPVRYGDTPPVEDGLPDEGDSERMRIRRELDRQHWRIGRTAAALGMSRNTLYRKLHRYGLMPS
jgi:transcriptional regulator of acetoin/glycerol metabolism